jgi:Uma2 family endonuclease
MTTAAARPLTVHDFWELPDGPPHYQLIEGDLFMSPPPGFFHQNIIGNLYFLIREYLEGHPEGTVALAPCAVELSDLNAYEPDLFFVTKERASIITDRGAVGAPDLVVEVLSPSTAKHDKGVKREVYARTGVQELWIVDPELKEVQGYRFAESSGTPAATLRGRQSLTTPLLPGLRIPLAKVFKH